ncbi:MAG: polysaccharide biosynthesis/export family protein [Verrucomicrobia bacterium]|nr:polysaccharide biosynthesis/export family protein [Verrucomicrobiota bacterium]
MKTYFLFLIAAVGLASCSGPYMGKELFGADEFVLDSYKIREGKFSILEMEGKECSELEEDFLDEYKDRICEDDILQIALYHPKRNDVVQAVASIGNTVGYRVVEGRVNLPDLAPICVAGLTLEEAREAIQRCYQSQIQDMEVFVGYKERIVRKVELAGMVGIPSVPVDGKIRLFDVLSKAKVPPEANLFKSYVARDGKLLSVDLFKLLKEGDMTQNIVMRGGDKVYIAETSAASLMVMGEVGRERVVFLPYGFMPLRHALAEAGGIPYTGDKSYIQVIRGNICRPKIYTLSWEHVIHLPNDSLLLMPGDIVYVASKPITEWNRFISQLLPSFTTIDIVGQQCGTWGVWP